MASPASSRGNQSQLRATRLDLLLRTVLVALLWTLLRVLGGSLDPVVSVAILAAIFGQDALRTGRQVLFEAVKNQRE
jgi:hypothetical protein